LRFAVDDLVMGVSFISVVDPDETATALRAVKKSFLKQRKQRRL
jgi:hypothetical protein